MEPYKDKDWLYEHYVKKRLNLTKITEILKNTYNIEVTPQAVYNWVKKYDLLKYRGKGRNLSVATSKRPKSPMQQQAERKKREMRRINKIKKKGRGF